MSHRRRRSALSAIRHMRFARSGKSEDSLLQTALEKDPENILSQSATLDTLTECEVRRSSICRMMSSQDGVDDHSIDVQSHQQQSNASVLDPTNKTLSKDTIEKEGLSSVKKISSLRGSPIGNQGHSNSQLQQLQKTSPPGVRFSFMRTYSHTLQRSSSNATTTKVSNRTGSFGSSVVMPARQLHFRSKTLLSDEVSNDSTASKARRISTPELINRRHLLKQKSAESLEQLRTFRGSLHLVKSARTDSFTSQLQPALPSVTLGDDLKNSNQSQGSITNKPVRKLSNFFRKISLSTSRNLKQHSTALESMVANSNNNNCNERDVLLGERDKALEEWNESAQKCEELIEELDITLSELIAVSYLLISFTSYTVTKGGSRHKAQHYDERVLFYIRHFSNCSILHHIA